MGCRIVWVAVLVAMSCGPEQSATNSVNASNPGGTVTVAQCENECASKGESCGQTAESASTGCSLYCGGGVTRAELDCFVGLTCEEINTVGAESCDEGMATNNTSNTTGGNNETTNNPPNNSSTFTCDDICNRTGPDEIDCVLLQMSQGGYTLSDESCTQFENIARLPNPTATEVFNGCTAFANCQAASGFPDSNCASAGDACF